MIIKMYPDQIEQAWDFLAVAIEKSLPPTVKASKNGMTNILISLLKDELECHIITDKDSQIVGVMTLSPQFDKHAGFRSLLIYSFASVGFITEETMESVFTFLSRYAEQNNFHSVTAYVEDSRIVEYLKTKGAIGNYTFMEFLV